jgi:plasmid maintenance system killer protein
MEGQTFRSRLVELIQKSRKAMRLYSNVGRSISFSSDSSSSNFAEQQTEEWRNVNAELVRRLTLMVESPQQERLTTEVLGYRAQLYSDFRAIESDLNLKQRDLIFSSENSDFVKAALLSGELVRLKARVQALQAAFHEVDLVIKRSNIQESIVKQEIRGAKVPPLSKEVLSKQVLSKESLSKETAATNALMANTLIIKDELPAMQAEVLNFQAHLEQRVLESIPQRIERKVEAQKVDIKNGDKKNGDKKNSDKAATLSSPTTAKVIPLRKISA